ncbi:MAG: hypothetical protein GY801_18635 [bacterium]|nr:hypothetical protein [bacterium]
MEKVRATLERLLAKEGFHHRKIEILVTFICACAGFILALPAYGWWGGRVWDGPCSGVFGAIQFSCYLPDIGYAFLSIGIPMVIFRQKMLSLMVICDHFCQNLPYGWNAWGRTADAF